VKPTPLRFPVNSKASNVVIGVALIPAIALLAGTFSWFEAGRTGLGVAAAAGFLVIMMGAGLAARRLSREIEVTEEEVREIGRDGKVTAIRWDEPHALAIDTQKIKRSVVTATGHARVVITAADRRIAFSTPTKAGMMAVAAALPGGRSISIPDAAIARMVELSARSRSA
jgi:hypothetical protein